MVHTPRPSNSTRIIPPDRPGRTRVRWDSINQHGAHRVYVTRLGPFSVVAFMFLFAVIVAAVLALFVGAVLFVLPVVVLLIAIGIVVSFLRPRARQRRW